MIVVVFLTAYIAIASALVFVFTVVEDKMGSGFYCWDTNHDRAVACAIFWPVSALPYVAYVAAVYYTRPRRRE